MNFRLLGTLLLGLAVMFTAFGVIWAKHETRQQYKALVVQENRRDDLEIEWGRLRLEQSALATHGRVESAARGRLGMTEPDFGNSIMVAR